LQSREITAAADTEAKRAAAERAEVEWQQADLRAAVPLELQPRRDWQEKQNALRRAAAAREKARHETRAAEAKARAEVEAGRAAVDKAQRDLEDTQAQLGALRVRAPKGGIFLVADHWNRSEARKLQAGDGIFLGQKVASLPDLGELRVAARLSAVDDGRVNPGQEARCILDTYPDRVFACRVAEVGAVAEERPAPGFAVRLALEHSDPELMRPGMSVRVEVVRRRLPRALLVPRHALETDAGRTFARLPGGGRTEVRLDGCAPLHCVVASGLREGQRVALR
jgi:multidrug efflux pump subunit AcrA (membrane-fusion protein)